MTTFFAKLPAGAQQLEGVFAPKFVIFFPLILCVQRKSLAGQSVFSNMIFANCTIKQDTTRRIIISYFIFKVAPEFVFCGSVSQKFFFPAKTWIL